MEFHTQKAVISQKAIVTNNTGKILLVQRTDDDISRPNGWDFPGGMLEHMEDPIDGIKREVYEETGLIIENVTSIGLRSFALHDACWTVCVFYRAFVNSDEVTISMEHKDFAWMTREQIDNLSIPNRYKTIIAENQ